MPVLRWLSQSPSLRYALLLTVLLLPPVGLSVAPLRAQQLPPPPDASALLTQALTRHGQLQTLCQQDREALIQYFQTELTKVQQERDSVKQALAALQKPLAGVKPEEGAKP